jgi:hydrogenase nickel incorporation protein HypB
MCDTCGCGSDHDSFVLSKPSKERNHPESYTHNDSHTHTHDHSAAHEHDHAEHKITGSKTLEVETDVLAKNNLLAERNRGYFEAKGISAINLVSSPGSGKTTLLEKLIAELAGSKKIYVIEGDQQTTKDADRIEQAGAEAIQINTGNGCHLDAHMINHAVKSLEPENNSIVFIENVGNLVCPALFDLGEQLRIVIASTTEGEDKPLKYPNMFQTSDLCILNKMDLLPYLDFDITAFSANLQKVKAGIRLIQLSAKTNEGLKDFISLL